MYDKKTIVLVGDSGCGKTALAVKLTENLFLDSYEPTGFEKYQADIRTSKGICSLTILDTSGCHEHGDLRALAYKGCDAVVLCFDLTNEASLNSIEQNWLPELKEHCPGVPFYISGCKRDAMCQDGCTCYEGTCCKQTEKELLEIVERTGAVAYTECSAALELDDGLEGLFQVVVETCSRKRKNGAKKMISSIKKRSKMFKRRLSTVLL